VDDEAERRQLRLQARGIHLRSALLAAALTAAAFALPGSSR
jgi:hypothetical protein